MEQKDYSLCVNYLIAEVFPEHSINARELLLNHKLEKHKVIFFIPYPRGAIEFIFFVHT